MANMRILEPEMQLEARSSSDQLNQANVTLRARRYLLQQLQAHLRALSSAVRGRELFITFEAFFSLVEFHTRDVKLGDPSR